MNEAGNGGRRRPPRRATRSATDGVPEKERQVVGGPIKSDDSLPGREQPGSEVPTQGMAKPDASGSVSDQWWHEQRPPHWA